MAGYYSDPTIAMYEDTSLSDSTLPIKRKEIKKTVSTNHESIRVPLSVPRVGNSTFRSRAVATEVQGIELVSVCPNCDRIMRVIPAKLNPSENKLCIVCGCICVDRIFKHDDPKINGMLVRRPKDSSVLRTCLNCGYKTKVFISNLLYNRCSDCDCHDMALIEIIAQTDGDYYKKEKHGDNNPNNKIISIW